MNVGMGAKFSVMIADIMLSSWSAAEKWVITGYEIQEYWLS